MKLKQNEIGNTLMNSDTFLTGQPLDKANYSVYMCFRFKVSMYIGISRFENTGHVPYREEFGLERYYCINK